MKKLSLEMLRLTSDEVLQRSQMKKITGGYGQSGTCGWRPPGGAGFCNISYSVAISNFNKHGGSWCCDSCGSSSYCS